MTHSDPMAEAAPAAICDGCLGWVVRQRYGVRLVVKNYQVVRAVKAD